MAITTHCLAQLTVREECSRRVALLRNKRQKTGSSRRGGARLPERPTSCGLFMRNLAAGPLRDPRDLLITSDILQGGVGTVSNTRQKYSSLLFLPKSNCISASTATRRSLSPKSSCHDTHFLSYFPTGRRRSPPSSPQITSSRVHQQLTNCEQARRRRLCLPSSPPNPSQPPPPPFLSPWRAATRITGNNVGIRGEAWCGLSLCSYY